MGITQIFWGNFFQWAKGRQDEKKEKSANTFFQA